MFKKDVKTEVLDQSSSRSLKDEIPRGVLGGNKNLHQTLSSATKKSSILNKAVVQRRYPQKQRDDRASPDRRDRYPNRYRDRSRSPVKNRGRDRSDNSHNSHYKKKGGGGKNGGKSSRETNGKK